MNTIENPIVRINVLLTAGFVLITGYATIVFTPQARAIVAIVDLALFAIGVGTFILGYFAAVQRSRQDEISVAGLFLLIDKVASRSVALWMNSALIAQVVVGLGAAIARRSTDGRAGSTLAFGVLVPLLGLGLNGLWASKHGEFAPRTFNNDSPEQPEIGKDGDHG